MTEAGDLFLLLWQHFRATNGPKRHWLQSHLREYAPSLFGAQLLDALFACELKMPGLGFQLLTEAINVPYAPQPAGQERFEELMQKLAEVFVIRTILDMQWPENTIFRHEPENPKTGKRPELTAETDTYLYLFEVKCPKLTAHESGRHDRQHQIPARWPSGHAAAKELFGDDVTWPKDNVVKDFLMSAQEKFDGFDTQKKRVSILFICWASMMYEIVSPLTSITEGLLTLNSYHKDAAGDPVKFEAIDFVVALNHWNALAAGSQDNNWTHRPNAFRIEEASPTPNIWFEVEPGNRLPDNFAAAFDAVQYSEMSIYADYAPLDAVIWLPETGRRKPIVTPKWKRGLASSSCPAAFPLFDDNVFISIGDLSKRLVRVGVSSESGAV